MRPNAVPTEREHRIPAFVGLQNLIALIKIYELNIFNKSVVIWEGVWGKWPGLLAYDMICIQCVVLCLVGLLSWHIDKLVDRLINEIRTKHLLQVTAELELYI